MHVLMQHDDGADATRASRSFAGLIAMTDLGRRLPGSPRRAGETWIRVTAARGRIAICRPPSAYPRCPGNPERVQAATHSGL